MDQVELVSRIAQLSGWLSPAEGTPPEALDQARRMLAEALLNGQTEFMEAPPGLAPEATSIHTLPQQQIDQIRRVADEVLPAQRDASLRIFRRTWPLLSNNVPQSVPAWAFGWVPDASLGPFECAEGGLVWFDVRRTAEAVL